MASRRPVPRGPDTAITAGKRHDGVISAATGELLPRRDGGPGGGDLWDDVLPGGLDGWEPESPADQADVRGEVSHLLGIGVPRRRYRPPGGPDVSALREAMGL